MDFGLPRSTYAPTLAELNTSVDPTSSFMSAQFQTSQRVPRTTRPTRLVENFRDDFRELPSRTTQLQDDFLLDQGIAREQIGPLNYSDNVISRQSNIGENTQWRETGVDPSSENPNSIPGGQALGSANIDEIGTIAEESIPAAEAVESSIPGVGEYFLAGMAIKSIGDSYFSSQMTSAQNFASTHFQYGPGRSLAEADYLSAASNNINSKETTFDMSSFLGPIGEIGSAIYNAFVPDSPSSFDTVFSPTGMVDGQSAAVIDTSSV